MVFLSMNDRDIREYINDLSVYHRGRMYFFNGYVHNLNIDETNRKITARVRGNKDYTVRIAFSSFNTIEDEACTCPYFNEWGKPCKHIAAVLLEARKQEENKHARYRDSHKAIDAIFLEMDKNRGGIFQGNGEQVHLYPRLFVYQQETSVYAYLELHVGTNRSYVVKNAEEFIEAWVRGKRLVFGRQLVLDSTRQFFSGRDEVILNILKDIYTIHHELGMYNGSYRYGSLIRGKQFQLMPTHFENFLEGMTGDAITASVLSDDQKIVPVTEEEMPVTFEVRQLDEWLSVKLDTKELPVKLTPNAPFYYYMGKIYKVPFIQERYLDIIWQGFKEAGSNEIIVPVQYQGRFISEVVPLMKKTGDVMVNPSLKEKIVQEQLKAVIYLDQYNKGIAARVVFHYGEHQVNPALNNNSFNPDIGFILRDIEKEQPILDILYQSGFFVEKDQFCLLRKSDIYGFVFEKMQKLQAMAEVYYSEDFKKVAVKKSINISGRVSLVDDLLEIAIETKDLDNDELKGVLEALRRRKRFFRLRDGAILPLEEYPGFRKIADLTEQMDISPKEMDGGVMYLPKYRALYLENVLMETGNEIVEKTHMFRQLVESLTNMEEKEYKIPKPLETVLRDYQKVGYQWLKTLSQNGLGGILADDMGLGKTLQVLTLVQSECEKQKEPSMVVAPTSLVYNWVLEAKKFTPKLKVLAVSGNQLQRQPLLEKIGGYDLVITSYPLIRRDIEYYKKYKFLFCFVDEAQHIKNHFTQSAKAVRKISARNRFALTGTPMENSLMELWAIFDFLMPSYLFSQQKFQERFVKPIINAGDKSAGTDLSRHIRPFILRRMKKDVLSELPEKIETTLTCELTEVQGRIYLALLARAKEEIEANIEEKGFEKSQLQILAALTRLRQVCCHPSTFIEDYEGGSGKLNLLEELIDEALESGHRILLFSQFTSMLDIIEKNLMKKEITYFYLCGKTPAADRSSIVSRFNDGEGQVFLLSLKAGGTGLTLTGADTVIHYDPWWNPAVEEQATDRAYRIGQNKVVQVFKLITRNTIEEKILLLQEKKKEMIDLVIKPGETMLHKLSRDEIRQLFEI